MIVVDTNVVAYFWIPGPRTGAAEALAEIDPEWVAPALFRYELRNVLATLVRAGKMPLDVAARVASGADDQVEDAAGEADARTVLSLSARSDCSAYDCEFVGAALALGVPLVTCDRKLAKAFPGVAASLEAFVARSGRPGPG